MADKTSLLAQYGKKALSHPPLSCRGTLQEGVSETLGARATQHAWQL